ncbi:c-type cytochrome [Salinarimonas sp.]|uniref:c-type cytochrome n=1 Tax=Salinarimonas sp. TaxID=2766526 RepID=UPI0032D9010C
MPKGFLPAVAIVALAAAALVWFRPAPSATVVDVTVPALSAEARRGAAAFAAHCAACHGANAAGSESGPPLIHPIYEPSHHADGAFHVAVRSGVRAHHWGFGNMPAQPHVSDAEVADIVAYVREVQRANGIR